jgi:hypothetical protein
MTLIDILEENKIEIPIIQRDYVQGLNEKKAKKFLEAIKKGINEGGLNLDFIYGNIKDEKFIPIDGQQRLTTLFLIYFYLLLENKYDEKLRKFSYAIRPSSKEFFGALTKQENFEKLKKENIVGQIKNSNWYFLSWESDLTVKSILNMLNMIEEYFKNCNLKDLEKIKFEFLKMEDYHLNEDLYVKMNARGKQLSDFENFKAEFEKYIEDLSIKAKLDNEWLDIFWKINLEKAEELYYNFFFNATFNLYVEKYEVDKNFLKENELLDFYEKIYLEKKNVEKIIKLLDNFNFYENKVNFSKSKNLTYDERLDFYIWSLGILKEFNDFQFKRWKRIAKNLINNTRIEDLKDFIKALRGLNDLVKNIKDDVYKEIDFSELQGINKEQIEEEKLKIDFINLDSKWEKEFIKAENHWYLNGQIKWLLDFANNDFNLFIKYRDKFFMLFNDEVKENKKSQTLIQRALLTFGDYLPNHDWRKYTFCVFDTRLRVKNENWRKVFNDKQKARIFKNLLDNINDFNDLGNLINKYTFEYSDWKSYFINPQKKWSVLENAKNYQAVFQDDEIFLNAGNTTADKWSWRSALELYTWYIFSKCFPFKKRENRKIKWRKEADLDEKIYGEIYYLDDFFSTGEPRIVIEKETVYSIAKIENELEVILQYDETGEEIKIFKINDILNNKVDLLKEIEELK